MCVCVCVVVDCWHPAAADRRPDSQEIFIITVMCVLHAEANKIIRLHAHTHTQAHAYYLIFYIKYNLNSRRSRAAILPCKFTI